MSEEIQYVQNENSDSETLPYPVVGIGASAGGVEAYIDLIGNLPADTGMAFVLVCHMAPHHESHLVTILQRHTGLPVSAIEDGMRPLPNHIYVIPPNKFVKISQGALVLEARDDQQKGTLAIDYFFRSLAFDQRNMSVGVVLSGMDSDGASGLKAIKGEGGITLVQDPATARHPDMPSNSIAADHVDLVVAPAEIAAELGRLGRLYAQPNLRALEAGKLPPSDSDIFRRIFKMLRSLAGVEFGLYKAGTVHRRISRRLLVTQSPSVSDYYALLQNRPEELRLLHEDLLVGLSWFFRDPEMYDLLKTKVFPDIFEKRIPQQQVRVWVAGCSTGEEVYSIAISLLEYASACDLEPVIQIFGTDVSDRAIENARSGYYPETIASELSVERIRRFFVPVNKGYQVSKRVRDLCVFARQNLCSDPPFSRIDLLTCRNVLIYLGQQLQRRVIPAFHYALKPNGFLVLGKSEALRDFGEIFEPVDRKNKIFAKLDTAQVSFELPRYISAPNAAGAVLAVRQPTATWNHLELQHAADRVVLATYDPPGLIVNSRFEILQSRGQMVPYLELAPGSASFHLLRLLKGSIAHLVRDAVQNALDGDHPVRLQGLLLSEDDGSIKFDLEVFPIQVPPSQDKCFLVLFLSKEFAEKELLEPERYPHDAEVSDPGDVLTHLRQDLNSNKLFLKSLIEERDLKNQELSSSNEEVQSSNEELQSTNEELETTKEELQSAIEELQTVNDELQLRNSVLTDASNDLSNLLISVNLPVLMLNNDLHIRHFTPMAQKLLNVRPTDIGRPISDIRLNLSVENLEAMLHEVLETLATREIDIQDKEGRWHIFRVRPYRTSDNKIEGVVLVLIEIDQLRRSQLELRQARDFAGDIIEAVQVPLLILSADLTIRSANRAFRTLLGLKAEDLLGRYFPEIMLREWRNSSWKELLEHVNGTGDAANYFEGEVQGPGDASTMFVRVQAVKADHSKVLLLTIEDITERRRAELVIKRENQFLAGQVRSTSQALGQSQGELRALAARLFTSQEEECQRVARELHDDIGQQLALVLMDLEQVHQRLAGNPDSPQEQLGSVLTRVGSLSDDVRRLSHRLHPSILDDLGLGLAIKSLVKEFGERERMPATLTRLNVPEKLSNDVAATLYRITQEALRNVSKHAGKTHVRVVLEGTDHSITLKVIDMGDGFDQDEAIHGLGLLSMAERAHLMGGTFEIQSELGRGTSITVSVPIAST